MYDKKVNLFILFFILLVLFSFPAYSEGIFISNITDTGETVAERFFSTDYRAITVGYRDDVYHFSFISDDNAGYRQNWIASTSDFSNFTLTQLTSDTTNKIYPCYIYKDIDFDLICIKESETDSDDLQYFVLESGETTWSSTITTFSETDVDMSVARYVNNRGAYIWIHTLLDSDQDDKYSFQMDLDLGSYTIYAQTGGDTDFWVNMTGAPYLSWLESESGTLQGTFYDLLTFAPDSSADLWFRYYNVTDFSITETEIVDNKIDAESLWSYRVNDDVYIFFVDYNDDILKFIKIDEDGTIGALTSVSLNDTINDAEEISLIEGSIYIWGVYIDSGDNLRRFKLNKDATFSLAEDTLIHNSSNISVVGKIYGERDMHDASTSRLITDDLIVAYIEGNPSSLGLLKLYRESNYDAYEYISENVSTSCVYDYDCVAKFGAGYECVNNVCQLIGAGVPEADINYTTGDFAYNFDNWLGEIGVRSTASKFFLAIVFIILLNVFVAIIFMAVSGSPSLVINGIVSFLSLFMFAYMGLIPLWVVVLVIIFGAGIIFFMFKGGGGTA